MDERYTPPQPGIDNEETRLQNLAVRFHNNSFRTENGDIVLTDPTTGEQLSSNEIPGFLYADKELQTGYKFLSEFGSNIDLTVMLSGHAREKASDFGANNTYEANVNAADIYLMEDMGWSDELAGDLNKFSQNPSQNMA